MVRTMYKTVILKFPRILGNTDSFIIPESQRVTCQEFRKPASCYNVSQFKKALLLLNKHTKKAKNIIVKTIICKYKLSFHFYFKNNAISKYKKIGLFLKNPLNIALIIMFYLPRK